MNGVAPEHDLDYSVDSIDLDSIKEFVIPKLLEKQLPNTSTTPDGRTILRNVRPQVEITRKFCPNVRRTSSYPDITKYNEQKSEIELKLQKQRIVNTELKRLLIASVGDSLANRLEALAHEKAQLSEQLNILAKQAASNAEQIESLAIQGDVWKSKFLAARVVANELSGWKDNVTNQLHQTQQCLQNFEQQKSDICYTLHQVDRILAETVVDMKPESTKDTILLEKLKEASICVAELLNSHAEETWPISANIDRLPPEPLTPNMNSDSTHYGYSNFRSAACTFDASCSHDPVQDPINKPFATGMDLNKIPVAQSYEACRKSLIMSGCKCCSERKILHL